MAWLDQRDLSKFWVAFGRDADGIEFRFYTSVLKEPVDVPTELLAAQRRQNERQALDEANREENRRRAVGLTQKVCELRLRVKQLRHEAIDQSISEFLVRWVWEHSIRNHIDPHNVDLLSSLVNRLLIHLGIKATKSLYQLRPIDFARYIHQRRVDDYSSGIVNTEVAYLNQMAREIKTHTGIDVAETLLLELPEFMQRHPFTNREIIRILDTVATMGARGEQWRTLILIMLYTGLRPADAAHLRYQDFTLEKGVINIKPSKTSRYRANPPKPKPLHDALALHLQALFASKPYQPGDFLCPLLASRKHMDLAMHFQRIMAKANINRVVVRKTKSGKFYAKSLYSLRCTSNTLLTAMGASREQAMVELDQTSDRAHRHYEFNGDARIMARRRAIINQLPGLFDPPGPPDLL